ncbi:hypothetical protein T05_5392, partial [Trichinella murrelli]
MTLSDQGTRSAEDVVPHQMACAANFIVPKLMKGATPNKLVKGVTANQMSIIGIETEPGNNLQTHNNAYLWIGAETESQHYVH